MIRDIFVLASMATLSTFFFSLIIGFSVVLVPLPFLILIIPLCLSGQLVFAMKMDEIAEWLGYKFKS